MATEFKASWSKLLTWCSAIATAIVAGVGVLVVRTGDPWVACLPVAILAGALPFVVRGFSVDGRTLRIRRLWWDTRVDLSGLKSAEVLDREAFRGTWRLCGNGGLFSFTGWYRNKRLGKFRLYATGFVRPVVLKFADRTIVVTPDDPERFAASLPVGSA
jgi:hypothetical protein